MDSSTLILVPDEGEREDGTNTEGEIVAMRNVREFPPMESWSSLVSRDSLLGGEVVRRAGREGGWGPGGGGGGGAAHR
jgi:hypothetical protein